MQVYLSGFLCLDLYNSTTYFYILDAKCCCTYPTLKFQHIIILGCKAALSQCPPQVGGAISFIGGGSTSELQKRPLSAFFFVQFLGNQVMVEIMIRIGVRDQIWLKSNFKPNLRPGSGPGCGPRPTSLPGGGSQCSPP